MPSVDYTVVTAKSEIPSFLRAIEQPRWCRWEMRENLGGRPSKRPLCKPGDASTFLPWDAVKNVPRTPTGGIGFQFLGGVRLGAGDHRLLGIDLDAIRDSVTGELHPRAVEILDRFGRPFTEVSPGRAGLHLAFCVEKEPPAGLRSKVRLMIPAMPNSHGKTPELQIFGLGDKAGYMCLTGDRLAATAPDIALVDSIDWLIERFDLTREEPGDDTLPVGEGESPALDAITDAVRRMPHGTDYIEARWMAIAGEKSASEAFQRLERLVVHAADGHGETALRWLMQRTAWGRGDVEESADPSKYARESWVRRDLARACAKGVAVAPAKIVADAFQVLPPASTNGVYTPAPPKSSAESGLPDEVFDEWEADGPLLRLATEIPSLDEMTGGGFPIGSRVFMIGAPNAGKTGLVLQLADIWLCKGIPVGFLGSDEEPTDVMVRLLQRRGIVREECELRSPELLARARDMLRRLPLRMWSGATTVEQAAVQLHQFAKQHTGGDDPRPPCVLVVDSVQTVRSIEEGQDETTHRAVSRRVAVLRACARRYRMLVLTTSEMSRAAYRHKKPEEQINDMAAAKESGAIEYSARILLSMRNVPGTSDVVETRIVKNKHGPEHRGDQDGIFLRLNRAAQVFAEAEGFEPVDLLAEQKAGALAAETIEDCARLASVLLAGPLSVRAMRASMAKEGMAHSRAETARDVLVASGAVAESAAGKRVMLTLDPERLPADVQTALAKLLG